MHKDPSPSLRVFISYSRRDEDFARELVPALQAANFEPYLDQHDIAAGEEWSARLGRLIEAADTILFVISPDSVASERCSWEISHAKSLNKRLLPIVWRSVDEAQVPAQVKQLNYIFFSQPHSFGPSLLALATALKTDIAWVREHTRIGEASLRWQARGRADALLLRGDELSAAIDWLKMQPDFAPEPSILHHEFVHASEDAEDARTTLERQRLQQIEAAQDDREEALKSAAAALRKGQRSLAVACGLFVCVIFGAIGWYNQTFLRDRFNWYAVMQPHMLSKFSPYVLSQETEQALRAGDSFRECAQLCPEMVVVPAGKFTMGSLDFEAGRSINEGPPQQISIGSPLAIGKFDVTFDEWDECVRVGGCPKNSDGGYGRGLRPVININWEEAKQYTAWLSLMTGKHYRLLSEAEWEYAARAGSTTAYSWGDDVGTGRANCAGCGSQWDGREPAPVGSFKPNQFGLFDMHGNVWQWTEDCYEDSLDGMSADGAPRLSGNCGRRVGRGGSWYLPPDKIRSAHRYWASAGNRSGTLSFRVARTLERLPGRTGP